MASNSERAPGSQKGLGRRAECFQSHTVVLQPSHSCSIIPVWNFCKPLNGNPHQGFIVAFSFTVNRRISPGEYDDGNARHILSWCLSPVQKRTLKLTSTPDWASGRTQTRLVRSRQPDPKSYWTTR